MFRKKLSQAKLNVWKLSRQSVSGKIWFLCMNGVHATSLSKWYQNGLGKAIILRSCTSPVSELFIAYISVGVKMCLSFMVQSCSFMNCAMLFSVHYNAHLFIQRVELYCMSDRHGCLLLHTGTGRGFACHSMPSVAIFWRFTLIIRNPKTNENY